MVTAYGREEALGEAERRRGAASVLTKPVMAGQLLDAIGRRWTARALTEHAPAIGQDARRHAPACRRPGAAGGRQRTEPGAGWSCCAMPACRWCWPPMASEALDMLARDQHLTAS
jgi:hypothetical protein